MQVQTQAHQSLLAQNQRRTRVHLLPARSFLHQEQAVLPARTSLHQE